MKKLLSIYYTNRRLGLRSRRCTFYEKSTIGEIGYLQGNDQGTAHDACLLVGCPHKERHRATCHGHNHQAANLVGLLRTTLQSKTVDNRKHARAAEADATDTDEVEHVVTDEGQQQGEQQAEHDVQTETAANTMNGPTNDEMALTT